VVLDAGLRQRGESTPASQPPEDAGMSRYRWTILAVGVGAQTSISAVRQGLPSIGPALRSQFGLSLTQLGVVFASVTLGIVLTLIAWGALADRIGERPVIAVGLSGAGAALGGAALAPGFVWLVAALLVAGMFGASATGATGRAVMGWFDRSQRGFALGIRQTGVPLGGGLAAVTLPLVAATWGLEAALGCLGAGCLIAAAVAWRWMREPAPRPPRAAHPGAGVAPLRDARLWRLAGGSGLLVLAQGGILGFIVIFLHDERGWRPAMAAVALAGLQVGGAVARVVAGRWSDRRQERVAPVRWLGLASSALLLGAALISAAPTAVLLPVLLAAGVLAMSWNGLSFTAAAEMSGRDRAGTSIGVQNTVLSAAGVLAPIGFAAVVTATSWQAAWVLLTLSQVAGVLVLGPLVGEERSRLAARAARLAARDAEAAEELDRPRRRGSCHSTAPNSERVRA
jgi:sugar phosphate permease